MAQICIVMNHDYLHSQILIKLNSIEYIFVDLFLYDRHTCCLVIIFFTTVLVKIRNNRHIIYVMRVVRGFYFKIYSLVLNVNGINFVWFGDNYLRL